MLLDSFFKGGSPPQTSYASFLNNTTPIFSQFGRNIYASDVVQMCIDCIASECSKLQPKHIRRGDDGLITVLKNDPLNSLFKFRPNPLMTTRDFIEKIVWNLFLNYNSFVYPVYNVTTSTKGFSSRNYMAFYPLNPTLVEFLQDSTGTLYVRFTFQSGYSSPAIPYSDIIHLRKKFSSNDVMGGGTNGQPDNEALLQTLSINDTVLQGVGKAIKASLGVRGVIQINTILDDDKQKAERASFEKKMAENESGILPMDLKGSYIPINIDPKTVDKDTLDFLDNKVLRWFGVSLPILTGDYTDNQKQAFYDKTIEPVVVGMHQGFTGTVFTPTELAHGNEIMFYYHNLEMMSIESKKAIADTLGNRGALTNNFLLGMFGIEPYEGGNVRIANLNFINAELADTYQMARAKVNLNQKEGDITDGKTE
jgi:HK97 family phage portal protein